MKKLLLILSLLLINITSVFAAEDEIVKTCYTEFSVSGDDDEQVSVATEFRIIKSNNTFKALVTQWPESQPMSYEDTANVSYHQVKADLSTFDAYERDDLNLAEKVIIHAIRLTSDPILEGLYSAGFDLNKVRSATAYVVGEIGNMGGTIIIEAFDKDGSELGSFVGGFLVSPCK